MKRLALLTLIALAACSDTITPPSRAPGGSLSSPMRAAVQAFVEVEPGVRLEYLDFGGSGEPVLLLAGLGNTAHVFEDFAPRLTTRFRVIALTRRGFGASSQPYTGYDTRSLAEDIRIVLDSLRIARVNLVGHSVAGDEMTRFASDHPDRVAKLVYLDAAYDRVALGELFAVAPPPSPPEPTATDLSSFEKFSRYVAQVRGVRQPDAELRANYLFGPDGAFAGLVSPPEVTFAILLGEERPMYGRVSAPALALFAVPTNARDLAPWLTPASAEWDATEVYLSGTLGPFYAAQRRRFAAEVAHNQVVELDGANHYVFLSQPIHVAKTITDFLVARPALGH